MAVQYSCKEAFLYACIGISLLYITSIAINYNMVINGAIVEGRITEYYADRSSHWLYTYTIKGEDYSCLTTYSKQVSISDTILVIYNTKKINRSRVVRKQGMSPTLMSDRAQFVVVNNMSPAERQELKDRLMSDLRKRYWVKSK